MIFSTYIDRDISFVPPCPRCHLEIAAKDSHCQNCNFDYTSMTQYPPWPFVWQAILLAFLVPVFLGAYNWGKWGKRKLQVVWLLTGVVTFVILFAWLGFLPSDTPGNPALLVGIFGIALAGYLWERQEALYEGYRRAGARSASLFKGTLVAFLLSLVMLGVAVLVGITLFVIFVGGEEYR
jgi:hypothetical protein